jgi:mannose-6-phosphate isomerase-like protein (cupin superfamily)
MLGTASVTLALDPPPTDVVLIDHTKVEAAMAKGGPLLLTNRYKIQEGRRVTNGPAEIHENDTDIFYVVEGSATFVTGGTPVDKKEIGPGEYHAKELTGGVTRHLVKGDAIVIPNGIPHQFTEISGTFVYHVVKVTK